MSNLFKIKFFCVVMFILFFGLLIIQLSQPLSYNKEYTWVREDYKWENEVKVEYTEIHKLYLHKDCSIMYDSPNSFPESGSYSIIKNEGEVKKLDIYIEHNSGIYSQKFSPYFIYDGDKKYVCKEAIIEFVVYIVGILGSALGFLFTLTIKDKPSKKSKIYKGASINLNNEKMENN